MSVRSVTLPKRVLVCDDERFIARLVQTWLEQRGHNVVACYDGNDALARLRSEKFDLLILDIMMPALDGFDVLRELRMDPEFEDLKIIMLTAKREDADIFKAYQYGADLYLT